MNYLLDTGIIIGLLREVPTIVKKYRNLPKERSIFFSVYSLTELYEGINNEGINKITNLDKKNAQSKILKILINHLEKKKQLLSLTRLEAEIYANLKISLQQSGMSIPVIDLLIGTIAIEKDFTLITTDKKHFQMLKKVIPQLNVEFW
ncbi:MAG: type II toxin-antitoxin system VapC family toxin [Candidatus Helarchaeota archaeon]